MNKEEKDRKVYKFTAFGHSNIKAEHFKTLEFTKEKDLTERGDCIVGVSSDFEANKLKEFDKKVKFIIKVKNSNGETLSSEHKAVVNKDFGSDEELVLRKSFFNSDRTYGFRLNRGANRIPREMVEIMQNPETKIEVEVWEGWF